MSQKTTETNKNVFAVVTQGFDKIHGNIERTNPQYLQSYTNLQQEYLAIWKNFVHSTISAQQQYASKIGINASTPEATTQIIHEMTEGVTRAYDIQSQIIQTAFDASRQNAKTINENATAFAELHQNIFNSWVSTWNTKQ